jgi:hypothetical protein
MLAAGYFPLSLGVASLSSPKVNELVFSSEI